MFRAIGKTDVGIDRERDRWTMWSLTEKIQEEWEMWLSRFVNKERNVRVFYSVFDTYTKRA